MNYREHILIIRLSALGDVAILAPVVRERASANPDVLFSVAAPPLLAPLFSGMENVRFVPTKKQPAKKLFQSLAPLNPTLVADMHHVNRIIVVDGLFRFHGVKVCSVRKNHYARWRMMRSRDKQLKPLKPAWQRYDEVFDACGLNKSPKERWEIIESRHCRDCDARYIGIAPFAQHYGKIWPLSSMERLVASLSEDSRNRLLLFGSKNESAILRPWTEKYPHVELLAGRFSFEEELRRIADLDLMVSMDSANMHFASCLNVPVVSIWGATHPNAGFYGWRQNPDNAVQISLPCRPCSAYGNKPCKTGDYRCLKNITPQMVQEKIEAVLDHPEV